MMSSRNQKKGSEAGEQSVEAEEEDRGHTKQDSLGQINNFDLKFFVLGVDCDGSGCRVDEVQRFSSERKLPVSGDGLNVGSEGDDSVKDGTPASDLHNRMDVYIPP